MRRADGGHLFDRMIQVILVYIQALGILLLGAQPERRVRILDRKLTLK